MKQFLLIFCLTFIFVNSAKSQSDEVLARSYFVKAKEAYGNGDYNDAISKLEKTEKYRRKTSGGIEALYVKCYLELQNYKLADKHLKKYFSIAKDGDRSYNEMLRYVVEIKEKNEEEQLKNEIEQQRIAFEKEQKKIELKQKEKARLDLIEKEKLEKANVEAKTVMLNKSIESSDLKKAEEYYNEIKNSKFFDESKVNNIAELYCVTLYEEAKRINTVYQFNKFLNDSKSKGCSKGDEIRKLLEEKSIKEADMLYLDKNAVSQVKAKSYYQIYINNFPNGSKLTYAKGRINTIELKQKSDKKKATNKAKYLNFNKNYFALEFSKHFIGASIIHVSDSKIGFSFNLKWGPRISGPRTNSGAYTDDRGNVSRYYSGESKFGNTFTGDQESKEIMNEYNGSYYPTGTYTYSYNTSTYYYQRKIKTRVFSFGGGVNYQVFGPVWGYANLDLAFINTVYLFDIKSETYKDSKLVTSSRSEYYVKNYSASGFRLVPEFGAMVAFPKFNFKLGFMKYPRQSVHPVFGLGIVL